MGHLVAIEGIDGSGKGTQAARLVEKLRGLNLQADSLSFPQYGKTKASELISDYLHGEFGATLSPKVAALLYAVDRFEASGKLREMLEENDVVVLDRFYGSNMAHQSARMPAWVSTVGLVDWIQELEVDVFGMPTPHATILIDIPSEISDRRVKERADGRLRDMHEVDESHLARASAEYRALAERFDWHVVNAINVDGDHLVKPVDKLGDEILLIVLRSIGQAYRLDPVVDFDRIAVAAEIHKTWSNQPWGQSSDNAKGESLRTADAAIAEMVRQLGLKVG